MESKSTELASLLRDSQEHRQLILDITLIIIIMQLPVIASLLTFSGYVAAQVSINVATWGDSQDCSGPQSFNQLIPEIVCQNAQVSSLQLQPGGGDSNGCFFETYQDSNCGVFQSRIGPLSGGFTSCIGQANPNTGELQPAFSFRLLC